MDAAEMVQPDPGAARAELHCPRREFADMHLRLAYSLPFNDCLPSWRSHSLTQRQSRPNS